MFCVEEKNTWKHWEGFRNCTLIKYYLALATFIWFRGTDLHRRPPGNEPGEILLLHPGIIYETECAFIHATFTTAKNIRPLCRWSWTYGSEPYAFHPFNHKEDWDLQLSLDIQPYIYLFCILVHSLYECQSLTALWATCSYFLSYSHSHDITRMQVVLRIPSLDVGSHANS